MINRLQKYFDRDREELKIVLKWLRKQKERLRPLAIGAFSEAKQNLDDFDAQHLAVVFTTMAKAMHDFENEISHKLQTMEN